jgi:hypothetical protein
MDVIDDSNIYYIIQTADESYNLTCSPLLIVSYSYTENKRNERAVENSQEKTSPLSAEWKTGTPLSQKRVPRHRFFLEKRSPSSRVVSQPNPNVTTATTTATITNRPATAPILNNHNHPNPDADSPRAKHQQQHQHQQQSQQSQSPESDDPFNIFEPRN